jgi:hypothetical protein
VTRARWAIGVGIVIAVVVAGGMTANRLAPTVPVAAGSTLLGRAVLTGAIAPDASDGAHPGDMTRSPSGQECLERIAARAGPLDLCWQAWRDPYDADPTQDYYRLRVYGTFGGGTGSGVRWAVVRARLVGKPSNQVFNTWPDGIFEGPCTDVTVSLGGGPQTQETLCGRTTSALTAGEAWSQDVTWTCESCLFPDHASRAIGLQEFVAVPPGTVPTWEIFGDLGG